MRIFIAILFNDQILDSLNDCGTILNKYCLKANFSKKDNYHLTLSFLGEISEQKLAEVQKALIKTAQKSSSFALELGNIREFSPKGGKILWVGLKNPPPALQLLYDELQTNLAQIGMAQDSKSYLPHITLARQAKIKDDYPLGQKAATEMLAKQSFPVQQIALMESCSLEGVLTYIPLATFNLQNQSRNYHNTDHKEER